MSFYTDYQRWKNKRYLKNGVTARAQELLVFIDKLNDEHLTSNKTDELVYKISMILKQSNIINLLVGLIFGLLLGMLIMIMLIGETVWV